MSIKDIAEKGKAFLRRTEKREVFTVLTIIFVALASFGLGRLSKLEESAFPIRVENTASAALGAKTASPGERREGGMPVVPLETGAYVASKQGGKYHFPWCSGAQRIKEENKVWFQTKEEAQRAGYEPAANCKGL